MTKEKIDSVTKAVLADKVSRATPSLTVKKSVVVVESDAMTAVLAKAEEVKISGFGKFSINEKKSRKGRNPKTGEAILIAGRRVLRFRVSDCLKAEMNGQPFTDID